MPPAAQPRLANARDVGGLSTTDGARVRPGVLYRADAPLAGDVIDDFTVWPPATVVDLRSPGEIAGDHPLTAAGTAVHTMPLIAGVNPVLVAEATSLVPIYRAVLEASGPSFADIARLVAHSPGPTLVHCAGGKDRTGMVVAALLSAVGVTPADIARDYCRTGDFAAELLLRMAATVPEDKQEAMAEKLRQTLPALLAAPQDVIDDTLAFFAEQPGGAAGWLESNGLSSDDLALLRERLVAPA